ncbi:MAG: protein translocase subunit SecF [Nitrospinota bacterium]|nr:protein translocase subunit SecF [Nitrospinota bacterium]
MIHVISKNTNIDFVKSRKLAISLSLGLIALSLVSLVARGGFNMGIDFSGGTMVQVRFTQDVKTQEVRSALTGFGMKDSEIQRIGESGNEIIIRTSSSADMLRDTGETIKKLLTESFPGNSVEIRRVEMVGPKVGNDLRTKGILAFLYSIVLMLVYIWWRFELSFGVGAVIALIHDVLITLGFVSMFNIEFDLKIVAAILTLVGYSINDTIVVYDRIRENLRVAKRGDYEGTVNRSINGTLSRTLLTSLTTFIVVVILFFFGGEVIHGFSFALMVGIVTGTYSSIYIASPVVLLWENRSKGSLPAKKKSAK